MTQQSHHKITVILDHERFDRLGNFGAAMLCHSDQQVSAGLAASVLLECAMLGVNRPPPPSVGRVHATAMGACSIGVGGGIKVELFPNRAYVAGEISPTRLSTLPCFHSRITKNGAEQKVQQA